MNSYEIVDKIKQIVSETDFYLDNISEKQVDTKFFPAPKIDPLGDNSVEAFIPLRGEITDKTGNYTYKKYHPDYVYENYGKHNMTYFAGNNKSAIDLLQNIPYQAISTFVMFKNLDDGWHTFLCGEKSEESILIASHSKKWAAYDDDNGLSSHLVNYSNKTIESDRIYHIFINRKGYDFYLYVDGEYVGKVTNKRVGKRGYVNRIGSDGYNDSGRTPNDNLRGAMSFVRFYKRNYTEEEIKKVYELDKASLFGIDYIFTPKEIAEKKPFGLVKLKVDGEIKEVFTYDGYILVASNNSQDSLFPSGTARNNRKYEIINEWGIPSPDCDYTIGPFLNKLKWDYARIIGWAKNLSFSQFINAKTPEYLDVIFPNTSRDDVTPRDKCKVDCKFSDGNTLHPNAKYAILDSVYKNTNLDADKNQSTIGGSIVVNSSGDPHNGTYVGWGPNEANTKGEGTYTSTDRKINFQGYTTWIKIKG